MFQLSVCIPTYNRASSLSNCLNSIVIAKEISDMEVEICVSDNGSTDHTSDVVTYYQQYIDIKYNRIENNIGMSGNFLNAVRMAKGEFVWLLGDDDLLIKPSLLELSKLFRANDGVDFFYINSFHLDVSYLDKFKSPFDTNNLPKTMDRFSSYKVDGRLRFMDLIWPKISFDFLGGIYLSVFRRENWIKYFEVISKESLNDLRTFSSFENTFPHIKIFSKAFMDSDAYFNSEPLTVNLSGKREWSHMYPLVHSIRLVEGLGEYRKNGMPIFQYVYCKNFALNNFASDILSMFIYRNKSGFHYINPLKTILKNCLYPNTYLSVFYFIYRKIKGLVLR